MQQAHADIDIDDDPADLVKSGNATFSQSFTLRAVVTGLALGVVVCLSNVYFGLQTGYFAQMSMSTSLMGFAIFRGLKKRLRTPFTPAENCLVQTVAAATGCVAATAGITGLIPALEFLLGPEDNGPIKMNWTQLLAWSTGTAFFGVVWAMILRKQFVVREKLPFPGATATAYLINVLHEKERLAELPQSPARSTSGTDTDHHDENVRDHSQRVHQAQEARNGWDINLMALGLAGALSGVVVSRALLLLGCDKADFRPRL
jgi:uncharacterized oligopeptide transporter (OPT) family protein